MSHFRSTQGPNEEGSSNDAILIARYYNDAAIGLKLLHELALDGSWGAREALHDIAQCLGRRAFIWKLNSDAN